MYGGSNHHFFKYEIFAVLHNNTGQKTITWLYNINYIGHFKVKFMELKKLQIHSSKFPKCSNEIIKYIYLLEKNWANGSSLFPQKAENSKGVEEVKNIENCESKSSTNVLKANEKDLPSSPNPVNIYTEFITVSRSGIVNSQIALQDNHQIQDSIILFQKFTKSLIKNIKFRPEYLI